MNFSDTGDEDIKRLMVRMTEFAELLGPPLQPSSNPTASRLQQILLQQIGFAFRVFGADEQPRLDFSDSDRSAAADLGISLD